MTCFSINCILYFSLEEYKGGISLKKGANLETIKDVNSKLVLSCIRNRNVSRADISEITGLARSAVTIITKQLISEGQITEIGTDYTPVGRSPILLDIVKDYRYAMGILFHRREIAVCIVNLKMECIEAKHLPIECITSPEEATDWAYEQGIQIMRRHHIPWEKCIGIGISSPGPLNCISGEIFTPPGFQMFHHFNPIQYLRMKCNYPVHLSNAPVPMAIYEAQQHSHQLSDFLFISVDRGVGAAIVQDGNVYQGFNGFAGEFGHMSIDFNGEYCPCGNRGCLETYITKKAIMERFQLDSYEKMIDQAYEGEEQALNIVEYIAHVFASAITNAVNMLDLDAVVIRGELNYRHQLLFKQIQDRINSNMIRPEIYPITVVPATLGAENDISYIASIVIQ